MSDLHRIVLSAPVKGAEYTRAEILRAGGRYAAALYTAKQVFHAQVDAAALDEYVDGLFGAVFTQYTAWDGRYRYARRMTKKGKTLTTRTPDTTPPKDEQHNRQKNHIFREGMDIPVLTDAGIFTREGRVAAAMRDKFVQISRFVELLADETKTLPAGAAVNIIDFGCGKSYLSFLVYHYFSEMRGLRVHLCGLDTDAKLVRQCNETAAKHGYENLFFLEGDIARQASPPLETWGQPGSFNIVISLHACDTATDFTLHNAVRWGADLICAVPCCQHELRGQMQNAKTSANAHTSEKTQSRDAALFSRYGIVQERVASLATDAIRAALLESRGYRVDIIELTDRENTAKNLLLRAAKTARPDGGAHENNALREAERLMALLGVRPALYSLFS